jgi:putative GTP pyrophosphokinase
MELVNNRVLMEDLEKTAKTFAETDEFVKLMTLYRCAIMEIETKLRVLDAEFSLQYDRNPFEHIESRLKNPVSIVEKMHRRNIPITVRDMERELYDIAGIRVVCSFIEDIYKLADLLVEQDDVLLVQKKDYIVSPKPNGYRSLHMIVDIPIFLSEGKKHMKVEVQFRTIAMDFWASVEHKLKYKKQLKNQDEVIDRLQKCASILSSLDDEMESLRLQIDMDEENGRE